MRGQDAYPTGRDVLSGFQGLLSCSRMGAMGNQQTSRVSTDEAMRLVGEAMYGDDWVGAITKRERWLLKRYVEGLRPGSAPSIMAGMTAYMVGGRRWAEYPSDPALVAETERARDRDDWCNHQGEQAFDWLENHGFDTDGDVVNRTALEAAMAKAFSQSAKPAKKGGRPTAVDWGVVKDEMLRLMDENAEFGPDSPEWNAQARLEEALRTFCSSRFGKRPANSTLQGRLKPWLDEWRNGKTRRPET